MRFSLFTAAAAALVFCGTAVAAPTPEAEFDPWGLDTTENEDSPKKLFAREVTSCSDAQACAGADTANNAKFLIGLGEYVINIGKGQYRQVAITNGCKIWAYGVTDSSSYARDYGYGAREIYDVCNGRYHGGASSGVGNVGGNTYIKLRACTNCNY